MKAKRARKQIDYSELDDDTNDFNVDEEAFEPPPKKRAKRRVATPSPTSDFEEEEFIDPLELHRLRVLSKTEDDEVPSKKSTTSNVAYDPDKAGFMSLPVELRLKVYHHLFVRVDCVDFGRRRGFAHSAELLSVNRRVNEEGSAVLYGCNKFILRPSRALTGDFFEEQWSWHGWSGVKRFLTDIGPRNISFLRTLAFDFVDATPSDCPKLSTEDRRFQHNKTLQTCLRLLALHANALSLIRLSFSGRSRFHRSKTLGTEDLSEILELIQSDAVIIGPTYRNRNADGEEKWWTSETERSSLYFENKIGEPEITDFVKKMTREVPLNVKMVERCAEERERARVAYEETEKQRRERYARMML